MIAKDKCFAFHQSGNKGEAFPNGKVIRLNLWHFKLVIEERGLFRMKNKLTFGDKTPGIMDNPCFTFHGAASVMKVGIITIELP